LGPKPQKRLCGEDAMAKDCVPYVATHMCTKKVKNCDKLNAFCKVHKTK
jgi:hypothetical protein